MASHEQGGSDESIGGALRLLREHLGLEVAVIAQLVDDCCLYRYVDAGVDPPPIQAGTAEPAAGSLAGHLIEGRVPEFLRDAAHDPVAATLPSTCALPVATHLGVPILRFDGRIYGMLGCFDQRVSDALDSGDLDIVRTLAAMVSSHLEADDARRRRQERRRMRLRTLMSGGGLELQPVFQPIVSLHDGEIMGMEALARFPGLRNEIPQVFADAHRLDVGVDLELRAVETALDELSHLPTDAYLAINVGPVTASSDQFVELLRSSCPARIMVEITEHDAVEDYDALLAALDTLGKLGVRLAIDDVGTGFSGLEQILRLSPDTLKIDGALVRDVDSSPDKQAMIAALLNFANRVDTTVVAEQIETAEELATLRALGVAFGQGYHFGEPHPCTPRHEQSSGRHRRGAGDVDGGRLLRSSEPGVDA